jgi:probable H4MPT-linked C1 transfer pathway protein
MSQPAIVGWDIGGVNTKVSRLARTLSIPFELQRDLAGLAPLLRQAASRLGSDWADHHAVTMTAELSQAFRTKREGVAFVLTALEASFPEGRLHVYTSAGEFVTPQHARSRPLDVAASNWAATAHWVAHLVPNCILIDIGTTTADLIPIQNGAVAARGRTDAERLRTGELVYSGVLRTPVEAFARRVPLDGATAGVSAEGFALSGDVYLWLGRLREEDYTCPTPDRRPATREYAGERLTRVVCADRELLGESAITDLAESLARDQLRPIIEGLEGIRHRFPALDTAVVTGLGQFLAEDVARAAELRVIRLSDRVQGAGQTAAATAVAWLLGQSLGR